MIRRILAGTLALAVVCGVLTAAAPAVHEPHPVAVSRPAASLPYAAALPYTADDPALIMTLGDSILCGPDPQCASRSDRATYGPRWQLDRMLRWSGVPHVIVDESIVGASVPTFLPLITDIVNRDQPDVVIISLGTNDIRNDGHFWNFYGGTNNYGQLVSKITAAKPDTKIIASWIQISGPPQAQWVSDRETQINNWLYMTVYGQGAPLGSPLRSPFVGVNRFLDFPNIWLGPDGVHPRPGIGVDAGDTSGNPGIGINAYGSEMYQRIAIGLGLPTG